jgi:predicted  nucleic acid-binding Zn-ribbon protein
MAGVILYLLYYVYTKDSDYSRNIRSVASVVEDLNRELFYLKRELKKTESNIENTPSRMSDDEIYQEIERSVYDMVQPLSIALKQIQNNIDSIEVEIESRMAQLESGVKQISIPSSIHGNDDEKIISLYKQGISVDAISKELHISKPEVEFVLKINKIK